LDDNRFKYGDPEGNPREFVSFQAGELLASSNRWYWVSVAAATIAIILVLWDKKLAWQGACVLLVAFLAFSQHVSMKRRAQAMLPQHQASAQRRPEQV